MTKNELDKWWSSLTIHEKEMIARKANGFDVQYPNCTGWWNALQTSSKKWIKERCEIKNGMYTAHFNEEKVFSE